MAAKKGLNETEITSHDNDKSQHKHLARLDVGYCHKRSRVGTQATVAVNLFTHCTIKK